jgi:hypothetical protein
MVNPNNHSIRRLSFCYAHGPEDNAVDRLKVLKNIQSGTWWDDGNRLKSQWFFRSEDWGNVPDPLLLFLHHSAVASLGDDGGQTDQINVWSNFLAAANSGLRGREVYVLVVSLNQLVLNQIPGLKWAKTEAKERYNLAGFSVWPESLRYTSVNLADRVSRFSEQVHKDRVPFDDFDRLIVL